MNRLKTAVSVFDIDYTYDSMGNRRVPLQKEELDLLNEFKCQYGEVHKIN